MKERQYYPDADLMVVKLAKLLKTQPHRLSEIINSHSESSNFQSFINDFRIKRAKSFLEKGDRRSVVDIAYDSGFNSKSAFYRQFTRIVGKTPDAFRRERYEASLDAISVGDVGAKS